MDARRLDELLRTDGPSRSHAMVRVGELPGGSAIDVPATVIRGATSGPTVWIMATRDGDEVHATLVAMELQRRLDPASVAGTVVVMPIGNVPGFGVLSREHPLAPTYLEKQMDDRYFDLISELGWLVRRPPQRRGAVGHGRLDAHGAGRRNGNRDGPRVRVAVPL